jgi:hypothetical protein
MNDDDLEKQKLAGKRGGLYTAKDFQFEVLGQLADVQELTESLRESLEGEFRRGHDENKLLRFDGRTLVAIGALALSITGYMVEYARNSTKRDAEIEATRSRVTNLERVAETNTEGRIRLEVELGQLREGQEEIKNLIEARTGAEKKNLARK